MKIFLLLFLLVMTTDLLASTWSKTFEVNYALGDGDSKSSARELALEQIKLQASNEVGTYIQSTSTLRNDKLEESIKVVSASMIKLTNVKETLYTKNDNIILTVSANVNIDESLLKERIKTMQGDTEKAKQIAKLKNDNDELLQELEVIKSMLAEKNVNTHQVSTILKRQTNLIERFKSNASAVSRVFSKGTLFQMAKRSSNQFEQLKATLDTEFFGPMLETKINVEIVDVVPVSDNTYTALVSVSWIAPNNLSYASLHQHLNYYTNRDSTKPRYETLGLRRQINSGTDAKTSQTEKLLNYLSQQHVSVQVKLGSKTLMVPMFWSEKSKWHSCDSEYEGVFSDYAYVCFNTKQSSNKDLLGVHYNKTDNPIKFLLTEQEAQEITTIEAKVIRT
ncbi:MAG: hypothetical protein ACSHWP_00205 [Pseudoalteromonas sp.]